ncbi:hypothetical protein Pcaca03_28780 [Pectobacterium carotovorum subsp. carotovorum]|uniref:Uncharacterized protein n=1 Tax=Pectobacterium carotovorum subsp. carotovorum TaxID=555 RepID=A0AAI9L3I5_PECCC|nr:hypothetical protein SOASR016_08530 [Pectobacterium carotovorum subsp. carotovorum]GKX47990.1 hypothetical protein SOASR016_27420 [Pectobacterium carotovorum subsp. carotovorum]GLV68405.1 hypothetical protein Pcaca03_08490 [Pectobacterium carotovorum subsp. carotovorum]GLV70434.1 hypothetical protein Pcaca03_28780 [Pectobacterium carotovorum subsp. carotovorum]
MERETLTACYTVLFGVPRGEWDIAGLSRTHRLMNQVRHFVRQVSL